MLKLYRNECFVNFAQIVKKGFEERRTRRARRG